ncbi:hypothetical protein [Haladaptatus sp. NG-WS-4]
MERIRDARDLFRTRSNDFDVDIPFADKHLAHIDYALHSKYFLDKFGLFGCGRGTHEQHTKREIRRFIVDLGMIAFNDTIVFERFDPVPDGTR